MIRAADGRLLVVCDTCVLINFLVVGRLDLLVRHRDYKMVITEHVCAEVTDPQQAAALGAAVSAGEIEKTTVTDPAELSLFAALSEVLGKGESAAIAVAANRGWIIATDERRRARREIEARVGKNRLLTTPGLLLTCIRNGSLTVDDADILKDKLAARRFRMSFSSFQELNW